MGQSLDPRFPCLLMPYVDWCAKHGHFVPMLNKPEHVGPSVGLLRLSLGRSQRAALIVVISKTLVAFSYFDGTIMSNQLRHRRRHTHSRSARKRARGTGYDVVLLVE